MENTPSDTGLSQPEAERRASEGLLNKDCTAQSKSVIQIIKDNICTLFNLINIVIAIAILCVGSYKNLLFMGIVISNIFIGIIQEIRAKITVDKLSLVAKSSVKVLRDGKITKISSEQVVLGDIVVLEHGDQIPADSVVVFGECETDESFITGEADAVEKISGDKLYAGSFVVSGSCRAEVEKVGDGNYISSISNDVRYFKKSHSEIMATLKKIIKYISIFIIPIGILLFISQYTRLELTLDSVIVKVSAALIGMIPEGLMLLTSTVLAVAVIRLSRKKVLTQDLYCIETLARVDTLCLDKTGTITEGKMEACGIVPIGETCESAVIKMLEMITGALSDTNQTFTALYESYYKHPYKADITVPFDSRRKWSGAYFRESGSLIIGAAEFVTDISESDKLKLNELSKSYRVLLLAHSDKPFNLKQKPESLNPVAFVLIRDKIRVSAPETIKFFKEQGVCLKVISGDNPATVSEIAKRAGIDNYDKFIDCTGIGDGELSGLAEDYTVFGRVTPKQKKIIINSLKNNGHTVAMTGDGVNDVMALKEADCAVAMASGSEAARNVSELVLLNSDFSSMPLIVAHGRRTINNIQRSASLFLTKTIYSCLFSLLFIILPLPYPFEPIHLSLLSSLTIGIPSFILALEPNYSRISGNFLRNILKNSLPGGLAIVISVITSSALCSILGFPVNINSTICVYVTAAASFSVLFGVCQPMNKMRLILFTLLALAFIISAAGFGGFFAIYPLDLISSLLCAAVSAVSALLVFLLNKAIKYIYNRKSSKKGMSIK